MVIRAGKTEALSDDLQDAERRVEFIRTTCLNTGKKLGNPSSGHDPAVREKRLVRIFIFYFKVFLVFKNYLVAALIRSICNKIFHDIVLIFECIGL